MKQLIFTSVLILASAMAGEAAAVCSGTTQVTDTLGTHETGTPNFKAFTAAGQWVQVAGLRFTTNGALTANQVSGAFASLANGATSGPAVALGTYSGTLTDWTSGPGTTAARIFTSVFYGDVPNLSLTVSASSNAIKPGTLTSNGTGGPLLTNLLTNHTVCEVAGAAAAAGPDQQWGVQEEHWPGGVLKDYKRGPLSTIDPPTTTGTWSVTGTNGSTVVNYTYLGGNGGGSYTVYDNLNGSYDFCNGAARVATVTMQYSINTGCPGFAHGAP